MAYLHFMGGRDVSSQHVCARLFLHQAWDLQHGLEFLITPTIRPCACHTTYSKQHHQLCPPWFICVQPYRLILYALNGPHLNVNCTFQIHSLRDSQTDRRWAEYMWVGSTASWSTSSYSSFITRIANCVSESYCQLQLYFLGLLSNKLGWP